MAKLIVDYREHAFLSRLPAETKNLVLGDICIQKDDQDVVILERKTVADLSASVCDGRYQEQSFRLLESNFPPHRIVYLIEGDINSVQSISKKAMLSCMISLWFTKGFSVVQTKNLDETVEYVQLLLEKVDKESTPVDYVSTLKIKKKDKLTPDNIDILMLSQIPTISTITAKALIVAYKNVFELTKSLKENRECLNDFTYGDKKRKLSKSSIKNLIDFLHV